MKSNNISPFKPKIIIDYSPKNFKIYTFNAGFKKQKDDLLILVFDKTVPVASVFSKTSTPSAPIVWDKKHNRGYCKVLIVNSGNANAHTGEKGLKVISKYIKIVSKIFKCNINEILVSSTGVIGEQLNPQKIIKKLGLLKSKTSTGIRNASKAIMTTDTFAKTAIYKIKHLSNYINIYGFAKGSGMIAPNMGTMLAYIFIEAPIKQNDLKKILNKNIVSTFNSISVDGDMSTSDTVMLFSVERKIKINKILFNKILKGVYYVMLSLAKSIVTDGEGISKLIEVEVYNAKTSKQANDVAFSIAESILVKTAIAGEDANWGRVVMAIGKAHQDVDQNRIIIKFNDLIVAKKGAIYSKINIRKLNQLMKNNIINIKVNLEIGRYYKKVWSSDLTHDYLRINSDYRS